jgi:hypothetical protein
MIEPNEQARILRPHRNSETRGLVTDVIVPIAQSPVGGAVGAAAAPKIAGASKPGNDGKP